MVVESRPRSAALKGIDESLMKEINDVLRTAENMAAADDTTTKEVTFYPPLSPAPRAPSPATIADLMFSNTNAAG